MNKTNKESGTRRKSAANDLIWHSHISIGTDNCLVTKNSADQVDAAHAAIAATETAPDHEDGILTPEYELAILSAVVHISDDYFWMSSCGNWKEATQYCPKISDIN